MAADGIWPWTNDSQKTPGPTTSQYPGVGYQSHMDTRNE